MNTPCASNHRFCCCQEKLLLSKAISMTNSTILPAILDNIILHLHKTNCCSFWCMCQGSVGVAIPVVASRVYCLWTFFPCIVLCLLPRGKSGVFPVGFRAQDPVRDYWKSPSACKTSSAKIHQVPLIWPCASVRVFSQSPKTKDCYYVFIWIRCSCCRANNINVEVEICQGMVAS